MNLRKIKYWYYGLTKNIRIEANAKIWDFKYFGNNISIGRNTVIGKMVYIESNTKIGFNTKIQNATLIYSPTIIEDCVFVGPNVVFTNDKKPRAVNSLGEIKSSNDWQKAGVKVKHGASIGAGAVCVAPVEIGKWAMVAAGSVVVKNVPDFGIVAGNPAKFIGWVGKTGEKLEKIDEETFSCPVTNNKYKLQSNNVLVEVG